MQAINSINLHRFGNNVETQTPFVQEKAIYIPVAKTALH
jgi:hypothetical protein